MKRFSPVSLTLLFSPFLFLLLIINTPNGHTQEPMDHSQMHHSADTGQAPSKSPEELAADKRFSEFNHHFAGVFILLVGLLAVLEPRLVARFGWLRYLWAVLFFAPGVYLFVWSDPESWPVGNQTLTYVITQNLQVLQHKVFSLILLGLGVVEYIRVRRETPSIWLSSVFPTLAGIGALLLLFHPHATDVGGGMDMASHMAMVKIERQHLGFAAAGFGIALSKAFADVGRFRPRLMRNLFAIFMMILGLLLLGYTE